VEARCEDVDDDLIGGTGRRIGVLAVLRWSIERGNDRCVHDNNLL
jgi:hypothetical protein